jgi:hypothetical protein
MMANTCLDERIKVKREGGGKLMKGSLFNKDTCVVHEVVGMSCARVDGVFHGW